MSEQQPTQQPTPAPGDTYTIDGTPVITRTAAEWDTLRTNTATRNPDDIAQQLAERKAAWAQGRKAFEAAQAAPATRRGVRRFSRLVADAVRSVINPAALIASKATTQPTPTHDQRIDRAITTRRAVAL